MLKTRLTEVQIYEYKMADLHVYMDTAANTVNSLFSSYEGTVTICFHLILSDIVHSMRS